MTATANGRAALADGIYPGMSRAEYERIEAANFSTIKHYAKTPAHAREAKVHPDMPTEAMELGTAFHAALFEPERFEAEYVAAPKCDRRTTAGKTAWSEFEEANRTKAILAADDMLQVRQMVAGAMENQLVRELLSAPGKNEVAVVWTDKATGLRCKALIDRICQFTQWTVVIDAKTTLDASPSIFATSCARLAYHEQAAFYLEGLNALYPAERRWFWIAVEKNRPFCAAVHEPDEETLQLGRDKFRDHLASYKKCKQENRWPGYEARVNSLRLPRWSFGGGD